MSLIENRGGLVRLVTVVAYYEAGEFAFWHLVDFQTAVLGSV